MHWRNEQIYHLRQTIPLTKDSQDKYFKGTIASLFDEKSPKQLLFSFLKEDKCIGYGGLVHINWVDKNAEISFIMATELETNYFEFLWSKFLACIQILAFDELAFNKIFTYAFDLRPNLYSALEKNGFKQEAVLRDHCMIGEVYKDVVIHSRINNNINLRAIEYKDLDITYSWAANPIVRQYSINKEEITLDVHKKWFVSKLNDIKCIYYIAENQNQSIGSLRIDIDDSGCGYVSYLVDPLYHGKGYGSKLLSLGIQIAINNPKINSIVGDVMHENHASIKIFDNLGFTKFDKKGNLIKYKLITE